MSLINAVRTYFQSSARNLDVAVWFSVLMAVIAVFELWQVNDIHEEELLLARSLEVTGHSYTMLDTMRQFTFSIMEDRKDDTEKNRQLLLSSLTTQYGALRENVHYFDASVNDAAKTYMSALLKVNKLLEAPMDAGDIPPPFWKAANELFNAQDAFHKEMKKEF